MTRYYMHTEARDTEGYDDGTRTLTLTRRGLKGHVEYRNGYTTLTTEVNIPWEVLESALAEAKAKGYRSTRTPARSTRRGTRRRVVY